MNNILRFLKNKGAGEYSAEGKVFKISRLILERIGLDSIPENFNYPMKKYRMVSTRRLFSNGWVHIIEINPVCCETLAGYKNTKNPKWPILRSGTAAINLPPEDVIDEFFAELELHCMEEN